MIVPIPIALRLSVSLTTHSQNSDVHNLKWSYTGPSEILISSGRKFIIRRLVGTYLVKYNGIIYKYKRETAN